jgi:hypothetical protein
MKRYEFYNEDHNYVAPTEDSAGDFVFYEDVKELIETVKEYLTFDSTDGRIKYRQPLRDKLKELVS